MELFIHIFVFFKNKANNVRYHKLVMAVITLGIWSHGFFQRCKICYLCFSIPKKKVSQKSYSYKLYQYGLMCVCVGLRVFVCFCVCGRDSVGAWSFRRVLQIIIQNVLTCKLIIKVFFVSQILNNL